MLEQQVSNWQGRVLGHYQFLHLLGRGGTGEVWLVVDQRDQRQLALKLLSGVLVDEGEYRHMFKREARVAASLRHPHVLPLYDFGEEAIREDEIVCYLVMPYVPDGTLRERISTTKGLLPVLEGLRYLRQAAEAIDYVHSQQVLHRDIKPANMLLKGDWLYLSDFGIARLRSSDSYRSRTLAGYGSPEYMAPEQIQRQAEAASDRYSLGISAYQIFTGALPFTGKDPYDVLIKQMQEQPPAPHLLNPQLPSSVESVLLRALAKRPEERYPSCLAFIGDLEMGWQHQLTAETVMQSPSRWETQPEAVTTLMPPQPPLNTPSPLPIESEPQTLQMAPMSLNKVSSTSGGEINTEPETVQEQQAKPEKKGKGRLKRRAVLIGGGAAALLLVAGGGAAAITLLKPQAPVLGPRQFISGNVLMVLSGHKDTVQNVAWDATSRYLATASKDTHVMLWDVGDTLHKHLTSVYTMSQPTSKWKFPYDIVGNSLHWTLDGQKLIISNGGSATFTLLDPFAKKSSRRIFTNKSLGQGGLFTLYRCVVPRPHSDMLAAIASDTLGPISIELWQLNKPDVPVFHLTYKVPASQDSTGVRITAIAWSCDGLLLAGHLSTGQVVIWNVQTRTVQTTVTIPPHKGDGEVHIFKVPLAWSPTDPHLLAAFDLDAIAIIDGSKGKILYRLTTDDKDALTPPEESDVPTFPHIISVTWSPNGRYVAATYARSFRVQVWDLQAHTNKTDSDGRRLQHHQIPEANKDIINASSLYDLSWSSDGRYLATSSFDFSTVVWQVDAS
jgi:serine/threonine protein kinase/WD40 repeat protein